MQAKNKHLERVKKTHKRTSPTSAEKSGNFSAEVWQLLTRSFRSRRVADFRTCSPFAQKYEWCWLTRLQDVADIKEPSEA